MKTYFPYYFRKIGIGLVIIAFGLSFYANINDFLSGFQDGWNSGQTESKELIEINTHIISQERSRTFTWISLAFSFSGFLLYMFSREKVEDEFIQRLRFMSLAKSLLFTWIFVAPFIIFDLRYKIDGLYILQFQLFAYVLIYNYYKKWKFWS